MDSTLNLNNFKTIIEKIAITIINNAQNLSKLDSIVGDGDHGTTIARGFENVLEKIKDNPPDNMQKLLKETGMTLISTMGGAAGPIFGSIFTAMADAIQGKNSIDLNDLSSMFSAALDKVKTLGGAEPGDKTMVDSLTPATESLKNSASKKLSLKEALSLMEFSALKGAQSTKDMVARKGRSRYVGERSLGHQDAGATTMYLIIKSINEAI